MSSHTSFFNVTQSALVLNILTISKSSASYFVLFTDQLRICWRAQTSVEFSWWHLCIVKMEHLFLPFSASLFTIYPCEDIPLIPEQLSCFVQRYCWKSFGIPWEPYQWYLPPTPACYWIQGPEVGRQDFPLKKLNHP